MPINNPAQSEINGDSEIDKRKALRGAKYLRYSFLDFGCIIISQSFCGSVTLTKREQKHESMPDGESHSFHFQLHRDLILATDGLPTLRLTNRLKFVIVRHKQDTAGRIE